MANKYTFSTQHSDLQWAIEKLIDKMMEKGFIPKSEDKEALISRVAEALNEAYGHGNVPTEIFTNPAQQKNIMSLVLCAMVEKNLTANPALKPPGLLDTFNTLELAKALFAPEDPVLAKQQISAFALTLLPPRPGAKKLADELAEEMMRQNELFNQDTRLYDANANENLSFVFSQMEALKQLNFEHAQEYGVGLSGLSFVISIQFGNATALPDTQTLASTRAPGYLNSEQDPTNPNLNEAVRILIAERMEDIAGVQNSVTKEMIGRNLAPAGAPIPSGPSGGAAG